MRFGQASIRADASGWSKDPWSWIARMREEPVLSLRFTGSEYFKETNLSDVYFVQQPDYATADGHFPPLQRSGDKGQMLKMQLLGKVSRGSLLPWADLRIVRVLPLNLFDSLNRCASRCMMIAGRI